MRNTSRWGFRSRLGAIALGLTLSFGCTTQNPVAPPRPSLPPAAPPVASGPNDGLPEAPADAREQPISEIVAALLTEKHVLRRPLDDTLSKDAFTKYLEELDGAKLFLLESQVHALEKYSAEMDDEMRAHDLVLAHKASRLIAERRKLVAKLVEELTAKPFDFSVSSEVETDPKKLGYCKTEAELRDRWLGTLKLQALERIQQMQDLLANKDKKTDKEPDPVAEKALKEIPTGFEAQEAKARKEIATRYQTRFARLAAAAPLQPTELFVNAIAAAYDPHTEYLAPEEKADFDIALSGTLEGIGAVLGEQDHYVVVRELVPGGASWRDGRLGAGDLIIAVAQAGKSPVDVTDMPIDHVVKMIRGPKGSVVTLSVKKPEGKIEEISITRDVVKVEATYARGAVLDLGPKKPALGYAYLPGFYGDIAGGKHHPGDRNATDDMRALLGVFQKQKLGGMILDLRGNGGGLLTHARDISGLFIPRGPVVQTRDSDGRMEVLSDTDPSVAFGGNVVVLVDRFSASAAEILAAALQDYERAVIIGTSPTHGKGTVQAVVDLDRMLESPGKDSLGVLKLTIEQYFRVNGGSVQWKGVTPDILLPDPASYVESGERTLYHSIPWTSVTPLAYTREAHVWTLGSLAEASKKRVGAEPLFAKIDAFTKLVKTRRDQTRVSVEKDTFFAEKKQEKEQLDRADPKLDKQKPMLEVKVLADPNLPANVSDDKKVREKLDAWKDDLARDPWVAESLHVLDDMATAEKHAPRH